MRFYNTLNTIALAGALLLSATQVKAMDTENKETLFLTLPASISIRILAHASGDNETNVGPIAAKYRLVCKGWKNAVDKESRTTAVGLLEKKSPLLRFKEQLLHVTGWHVDRGIGLDETDPINTSQINKIRTAVTARSPLKLIRISAIWDEPVLPRPKGFNGPDAILFGVVELKGRKIIAVIRAKVAP